MLARLTAAVCLTSTLLAASGAALIGPPSGRPPTNALRRFEPKMYDISFDVTLSTLLIGGEATERQLFNVTDAPIVLPMIYQGAYSKVFPNTEDARVLYDSQVATNITRTTDENRPFHTHQLRVVVPRFTGQAMRITFVYRMQSWSADIDEPRAQQSTWPRNFQWDSEVADGLKPQMYIESDNQLFRTIIDSQGGQDALHSISPYLAAKQIVAYVLSNWQPNGTATRRGFNSVILGMNVNGALAAATTNAVGNRASGTDHDLVCLCVAMLRAAGIPARPVVGIEEDERSRTDFVSWAEFYLPGSGWVPFDPAAMHGGGAKYANINAKWEHFGDMEDLNERVPLSYHFFPPGQGLQAPGYPAIWGWDPRTPQPSYEQVVKPEITSRGPGQEDPR